MPSASVHGEEAAFWLLSALVERVQYDDLYAEHLLGCQVGFRVRAVPARARARVCARARGRACVCVSCLGGCQGVHVCACVHVRRHAPCARLLTRACVYFVCVRARA